MYCIYNAIRMETHISLEAYGKDVINSFLAIAYIYVCSMYSTHTIGDNKTSYP